MSDLVERVARVMAKESIDDESEWQHFLCEARATIRVVLEEVLSKAVHDPEIYHTIYAMIPKDGE